MARTAYHYVKTLDFASDVALGMDSLSPKFVSSPLPKDSRRLLLRAVVAGELFSKSLDSYGPEAPISTEEVTRERCRRQIQSPSNAIKLFKNSDDHIAENCFPAHGNCTDVNPKCTIIDFGITSPSRVVSSKSILDFNNNFYSNFNEHYPLTNASNGAPGNGVVYEELICQQNDLSNFMKKEGVSEYSLLEKKASNSAPGNGAVYEESIGKHKDSSNFIKREPIGVSEYSLHEKNASNSAPGNGVAYEEFIGQQKDSSNFIKRELIGVSEYSLHEKNASNSAPGNGVAYEEFIGQHKDSSNFMKREPIGVAEYSLLERGVACFLKKCKDEAVTPLCPLPDSSPDVMTGICKNEQATSCHDDTGIGSLDDDNLTISDDSLDGRGIQYVSELKGTILRLRKLSKEADTFKTAPAYREIEERMMNFEASVKSLKLQAMDLKKRIRSRNRRGRNPYYWSRFSFNKAV